MNKKRIILIDFIGTLFFFVVMGNLAYATASIGEKAISGLDGHKDYALVDMITLGDAVSEQAHQLVAPGSEVLVGAAGELARVSLPNKEPDYFGGDISFTMKVDPNAQNYFTLKLWGSDPSEYRCFLAIGKDIIYQAPLVIAKLKPEAPIEKRFYFSTVPIPLEKTKGKTQLTLTLKTVVPYYPYSAGTFSKAYPKKMTTPSNKYYMGYVHTTAALAEEVVKAGGKLTTHVPPVRDNGTNGSDLEPASQSAKNMQAKLIADVQNVVAGIMDRDKTTKNFSAATWKHIDNRDGSGTMLLPYSQSDRNLYNLKYFSQVMLDNKSPEYDQMIKKTGIDNMLKAMQGAMDRNVINYLNRPGTIQTGGHQSSWGGYYQGLGEALWNVRLLFDNGRYKELGGKKYANFDEWFNGAAKINWQDKFSTVADFFYKPEVGKSYPFLLKKAPSEVGEKPYITTRRAAYEEILWLNYNYARTHAYTLAPLTNQVMFQMFGAWRSNAGLLAIDSPYAENYTSSLRLLYRSTGVLPYFDIDIVAGKVEAEAIGDGAAYSGKLIVENIDAFNDNTQFDCYRNYIGDYRKARGINYHMSTKAGLTREPTYVAGYGEHSDHFVYGWRLIKDTPLRYKNIPGHIIMPDESALLKKALDASHARGYMKYQDVDGGYRSMRLEATIEARGPFYPYDSGYHVHMALNANTAVNPFLFSYLKQELEGDSYRYKSYFGKEYAKYYGYAQEAVGYAQQMLADNQLTPAISRNFGCDLLSLAGYRAVLSEKKRKILLPSTNLSWYSDEERKTLKKDGFNEVQHYKKSFYDIENSIVYFRDQDTVYMTEFQYKSSSGINGVSRIHAIGSNYDRIAMIKPEIQYSPSGFWNFGTGDTTVAYDIVFDPVTGLPDGSKNITEGELYPVASWPGYDQQIALSGYQGGSIFAGYGEFYSVPYGKYIIAMNTTRDEYHNGKDYTVILPANYQKSKIYDKISNTWLRVKEGKVIVPKFSAVALDLGSEAIAGYVPAAPLFATGIPANGTVTLTWTHSAGTSGRYEIFRKESNEGQYTLQDIVDHATNVYVDTTVANGRTYYYKIRGVNNQGKAGNFSPHVQVYVSSNTLAKGWSLDSTVWSLDKHTEPMNLRAVMEDKTIRFTGGKDYDGTLLFAYTSNLLSTSEPSFPVNGDFEFSAQIKSGQEIGIMFKESLDAKSRGGFLSLDADGNYKFVYRQQPNIVRVNDMRVDGYHIFNNLNPEPVTGRVEGAAWLKISRIGLYVYAYVSRDGKEWTPIGQIGFPLYPEKSPAGEKYFLDNGWNQMKTPGQFYLPMAKALYVGIASSGLGQVSDVQLSSPVAH